MYMYVHMYSMCSFKYTEKLNNYLYMVLVAL